MNIKSSLKTPSIGDLPAYTVSELNRQAKNLLETSFSSISVIGEISNLSLPSSGHWYFSLKDDKALVRCAMFKGANRLHSRPPENGARVHVRARVSLYEGRGDFQLIVEQLNIAGTGELLLAYEALKKKLSEEGLFSQIRKKNLPPLPRRIALITSPTGAVVKDILTILKRRYAGIAIVLFPVPVQGQNAAAAITKALKLSNKFYQTQSNLDCDLVIIARGGGSPEDLWAFNDEKLARAIASNKQPVVSAVGHETDFTICDLVADIRASTPSAAAEKISPDSKDIMAGLMLSEQRIVDSIRRLLTQNHARAIEMSMRLKHPNKRIEELSQRLDDSDLRLRTLTVKLVTQKQTSIQHLTDRLKRQHPEAILCSHSDSLTLIRSKLAQGIYVYLANLQKELKRLTEVMHATSPLATLARGYSITSNAEGDIIQSNSQVSQGDRIRTQTASGHFTSVVADGFENKDEKE